MRGEDLQQHELFSNGTLEERIPADLPLRPIRAAVDEVLKALDGRFNEIYDAEGRPSIPPERLLMALRLQILYSLRSERMLMEQLPYNLLFRCFVGLSMDEAVWYPTAFKKKRYRLLDGAAAEEFFSTVMAQARAKRLRSHEHFTVDRALIEPCAGEKSLQPKRGGHDHLNLPQKDPGSNPTVDFRQHRRCNDTHEYTTDRFTQLFKKSKGAEPKPRYLGHVLTENRNGLVVDVRLTLATGTVERQAALEMLRQKAGKRVTIGADHGYDTRSFVE